MSSKIRFTLLIKIIISLGLIWLLYSRIPLEEVSARLVDIDLKLVLLVFVLLFANTMISSWKWQILLRANGIVMPIGKLFRTYMIGTFFNIFLPSNVGGDTYRIYDLAKLSSNPASSFASVFADRLSGFLALIFLALFSTLIVSRMTNSPALALVPVVALIILGFILWAVWARTPAKLFMRWFRLDKIELISKFVEQALDAFAEYRQDRKLLIKIIFISFLFQISVIICVYLEARALGIDTLFIYFCIFVPLISLVEALPISIYGIGTRDVAYVFLFGMVGLTSSQAGSIALVYLSISVVYSLLGGIFFLLKPRETILAGR